MTDILFWTLTIYAAGMTLAFAAALTRLEVERTRHRRTKWLLDHGCKEERRCGKVMKKTNSKSKHIVTRKPTGEIWGGYSARPTGKGPGKPPKGGTGKTGKGSGNEQGALKYGERNCEKGIPISSLIDSAFRHLSKYMQGMDDENHLAAALWNVAFAIWMEKNKPEMQDIPTRTKEGAV